MTELNRIKAVLREQNKTGVWLAQSLHKDVATVSRWCSNKMQPSLETLFEIAATLDIDVRELINKSK